ncbi:MAG: hypothetical protein A3K09_01675 [Nitrospinae bacterium RIFCSPLOWO2_12_FULL_47_7]|nr:MAG: hypothetical protein A3K09_01675 [Nitrospinae bacterium RIFCSPLOWO2_12_FULL_47_7]
MKSSPLNSLMETAPTVESFCRKIFQREDQLNLYFSELSQNGCIQEFEIAEAFSTAKHCQISGKILRLSEDNYLLQGFFIGLDPVKEPEKNLEIKILESILASVGDAVFAYDKQGKTIFQSWRHQRWFKNPSPCARLFADELANEWGKPLKLVEELADDEGKKLYLEITRHPVKNEAGEIYAGVDIVHDITASRELEWKSAEARTIKQSQTRSVALKKIIGQSRPFKKVLEFVDKISKLDTVVFIQGDTGTGKEVIAKAIHDFSPRANKPFVAINCGALSETLLDSELFGHVKGAFTSADADSKGLFEAADGGTIFLDEIGEMSLGTQVKLLRVLQDGEVRKLGSSTSKKVDIRILTATHRNIESMIDEGKFREDLYYRIHVFTIYTPTLGERKEDIPILAEHFLKEFASRQDKIIHSISDQAIKILLKHPWPGNIRELRNVIERATVLCESNCLLPDDLLLSLARNPAYEKQSLASNPLLGDKEEYTDQKILDCLKKNHWNKTLTAKELKISRATLWRKTKEISFNP